MTLESRIGAVVRTRSALRHGFFLRPEILLFTGAIAVFNAPVLVGSCFPSLMFESSAVRNGEWWRLFTHPFVHVTWYHLVLDGTAFLALYSSLIEPRLGRRLLYVFAGAAGSLLLSWAAAPARPASGLCGLSGIAHGLMAVSALEMVGAHSPHSAERRLGMVTFLVVILKAAFEAISGRMFFAFLDFGLLGDPVTVSHAGGIVGSLLVVALGGHRARESRESRE